jgi:superfamily I DNA and RNA helicase
MRHDKLGSNTLRSFTGRYDLLGHPVYSEGDLLLETVYRFKGQAAPAVIFTEIDFETLDEKAVRKLFVGATRATMKLVMVISERAAKELMARLG